MHPALWSFHSPSQVLAADRVYFVLWNGSNRDITVSSITGISDTSAALLGGTPVPLFLTRTTTRPSALTGAAEESADTLSVGISEVGKKPLPEGIIAFSGTLTSLPGTGAILSGRNVSLGNSGKTATNFLGAPLLVPMDSGIRIVQGPRTYVPEAERIFAAFTTPPTVERKGQIDALVVSLMNAGVWNKFDALYLYHAADSQAAKINWILPGTYDCVEVNAPAFSADHGFTGGPTKYLDTNFSPTTAPSPKLTQNSAMWLAYSNSNLNVFAAIMGQGPGSSAEANVIFPRELNRTAARLHDEVLGEWDNTDGTGLFLVSRMHVTKKDVYHNGIKIGESAATSVAPIANEYSILMNNVNYWGGQCAAGGWGSRVTGVQQLSIYNAIFGYLNGSGNISGGGRAGFQVLFY